jgi:hypothetical protein
MKMKSYRNICPLIHFLFPRHKTHQIQHFHVCQFLQCLVKGFGPVWFDVVEALHIYRHLYIANKHVEICKNCLQLLSELE